MSIISSTTGHSARGERNIARILYATIIAAVLLIVVALFIAGQGNSLNPNKTDDASKAPPAAPTEPITPVTPQ